jgi:hypothetical protein
MDRVLHGLAKEYGGFSTVRRIWKNAGKFWEIFERIGKEDQI